MVKRFFLVRRNLAEATRHKTICRSEKEVKISKERKSIVIRTVEIHDDFDLILHKFDLHKALWISVWILRFINNCRKNKKPGPLTTVELVNQKNFYIKGEQEKVVSSGRFEDDEKKTKPREKRYGVYICKGRFMGFILSTYPKIQY